MKTSENDRNPRILEGQTFEVLLQQIQNAGSNHIGVVAVAKILVQRLNWLRSKQIGKVDTEFGILQGNAVEIQQRVSAKERNRMRHAKTAKRNNQFDSVRDDGIVLNTLTAAHARCLAAIRRYLQRDSAIVD